MPVFSVVFLSVCEKLYVKNSMDKVINIPPPPTSMPKIFLFEFSFIFLCVMLSFEFQRFVICFALFLGYLFHCIFINKNFSHKKFWLGYVVVVFSSVITFFLPIYKNYFSIIERANITAILNNYLLEYYRNFIYANRLLFFVLAGLIIIALIFSPKNDERKRLFVFEGSVLISVLLFPLAIIFVSIYGSMLMVGHWGIILMTKIYLLNLILSMCGWLISSVKYNSIKAFTVLFCFIPMLCLYNLNWMDLPVVNHNKLFQKRIFILERVFDLYEKNQKVFLNCNDFKEFVPEYSLIYFIYLYDRNAKFEDYKQVVFCKENENIDECNKKLIDFLKEKTGYSLSEKEIDTMDFQKYYRY